MSKKFQNMQKYKKKEQKLNIYIGNILKFCILGIILKKRSILKIVQKSQNIILCSIIVVQNLRTEIYGPQAISPELNYFRNELKHFDTI